MISRNFPEIKFFYKTFVGNNWYDISDQCISFTSNHDLSSGFTNFNATFKDIPIDTRYLLANSMVRVFLKTKNKWYPILTPGFINRPSNEDIFSGGYSHNIKITGQDFGKLLTKHNILYMMNLKIFPLYKELVNASPENSVPEEIIPMLIKTQIFNDSFICADGKQVEKHLDVEKMVNRVTDEEPYRFELSNFESFYTQQGSLWQIANEYSNPLLNELFLSHSFVDNQGNPVDEFESFEKSKTFITLRRRPFYSSDHRTAWDDLKKSGLFEFDPFGKNIRTELGVSDDDVYTFWMVSGAFGEVNSISFTSFLGGVKTDNGIDIPIIDDIATSQYGLITYMPQTPYIVSYNQDTESLYLKLMAFYTLRMFEYYTLNDLFKNGTITIAGGAPELKAGMAMKNIRTDEEFYCQSVSHNYSISNNRKGIITTANVVRGMIPEELKKRLSQKLKRAKEATMLADKAREIVIKKATENKNILKKSTEVQIPDLETSIDISFSDYTPSLTVGL